jgi:hypothetical protein
LKIVAIGKCKDLDMRAFEDDEEETRGRAMQVPKRSVAVVRQNLRFFFLKKRQMSTVQMLHEELKLGAARHELQHFAGEDRLRWMREKTNIFR